LVFKYIKCRAGATVRDVQLACFFI